MRVIEAEMLKAIRAKKNWHKDNTSVIFYGDIAYVRLYDNLIAEVSPLSITLWDGGHQSRTTKSRLNALLDETGRFIIQKNYVWIISGVWYKKTGVFKNYALFETIQGKKLPR